MYGLKEASRVWFIKLSKVSIQFWLTLSLYNFVLFVRNIAHGCIIFLLNVNNMIIIEDNFNGISKFKAYLNPYFM